MKPIKFNSSNEELTYIVEAMTLKMKDYIIHKSVDDIIIDLSIEGKLENLKEYVLIVEDIKENLDVYMKAIVFAIKHVVYGNVKEVPLTVLNNMLAEVLISFEKASTRIRIATAITKMMYKCELYGLVEKAIHDGYKERVVVCKYAVTTATKDELTAKHWKLPTFEPYTGKPKVFGHRKKHYDRNAQMDDIIQKLNNVGYTLDERVWNKYKLELAAYRFSDFNTQESFLEEGDKLVGKTFYFAHGFGPDNGRIYCEGDLFTLQGGALNYVYKFADKRKLTEDGLNALREHVAMLEADLDKLSFKERVEYYSLMLDLIDAEKGLPVGTILHKDAKLSGLQHQCIATRNKEEALYCGLLTNVKDGYSHIRAMLTNRDELTREMVKKAYNPYQYGAGTSATVNPVRHAGGNLKFDEWESAYKRAFPGAFALRGFLMLLVKQNKSDVIKFTSPSGFNCEITALGKEEESFTTCWGKIKYTRKEINLAHMGVKLVAAFSHMLDAATLHHVVRMSNFDLHVVHDSFGAHPNDIRKVQAYYIDAMRQHLVSPILRDFAANILGEELADVNVSRYMRNTLHPADIVGGLY